MEVFPEEVERRHKIGKRYDELFDKAGINHVIQESNTKGVFAQYTIFSEKRDELSKILGSQDIPTAIYYSLPIYSHLPYDQFRAECIISEKVTKQIISLPMHPYLPESDQKKIVDLIVDFESGI